MEMVLDQMEMSMLVYQLESGNVIGSCRKWVDYLINHTIIRLYIIIGVESKLD